MVAQLLKGPFTVDDYHRLAECGILHEDDRVELIDGQVVQMGPIGSRHSGTVGRLTHLFGRQVRERAIVWVQNPVRLGGRAEPQPDLCLLRPRDDFYTCRHPEGEDVLLVVEVTDTSIDYDREVKLPLYARSGIPEVWLVDLATDAIEVHREPRGEGYANLRRVPRGDTLTPLRFPDLTLRVDEILG